MDKEDEHAAARQIRGRSSNISSFANPRQICDGDTHICDTHTLGIRSAVANLFQLKHSVLRVVSTNAYEN
ncbi:hypothetical protein SDJN02_17578, partial [Cucurbita argyrosperma subsp. argyrosperma]